MAYDAMGYYIGDYDPYAEQLQRLEEERKKREQEADNTAVHTQQTTTYANGSQTHKTTTEVPAPAPAAQPAYQAPPPPAQPVAQAQPVAAPVVPDQAQYNASIAQQESGANPNIGYHDQAKSSAYGTYGMTAPAYADARKLNPNLPADITQATPEQQNQAMTAFTAQNAKYLKNYGIEPTQQNLSAAHFSGASGLNDFFTKKDDQGRPYISPAAQAANGGYDKARSIIESRLGGQPAAASGAVNQPPAQAQPQPVTAPVNPAQPQIQIDDNGNKMITNTDGTTTLLGPNNQPMVAGGQEPTATAQYKARALAEGLNDTTKAYEIYKNPQIYGKEISGLAGRQVADALKQDMQSTNADATVKQYFQAALGGDRTASLKLADIFSGKDKTEESSYAKKFLTHLIFGAKAAEQYGHDYLGEGAKWDSAEIPDGKGGTKHVSVKFSANGQPLSGIDPATRQPITGAELQSALAAGAAASKPAHQTPSVHGVQMADSQTGAKGLFIQDPKTNKNYILSGTRKIDPDSAEGRRYVTMSQNPQGAFQGAAAGAAGKGAGEGFTPGNIAGLPGVAGTGFNGQVQNPPAAGNVGGGNVAGAPAGAPAGNVGGASPPVGGIAQQRQALELQGTAKKEIITEAAKEVAKSADTQNLLNSINKITGLIDSGKHNIGSELSVFAGRGPIAQAIGKQFETVDAKNTKTIMDTVQKLAADGLKVLGTNPSTVDLEFWTKFKPDAASDPDFVKDWIQSRSDDLKRRLGYAEKQVGAGGGGSAATSVPANNAPLGSAQNPIKLK